MAYYGAMFVTHVRVWHVHHVRQQPREELHRVRLRPVCTAGLRGLRRPPCRRLDAAGLNMTPSSPGGLVRLRLRF